MKIDICINQEFDYFEKRFEDITIIVQGYCFYNDNLYNKENFAKLFQNINSMTQFKSILSLIDGLYTVIIKFADKIFASVDSIRSHPLFYAQNNDIFILSDDAYAVKNSLDLAELDNVKIEEFICLAFTTLNTTIVKNLYQIDTGQCIEFNIDTQQVNTFYYYYYISDDDNKYSKEVLLRKADTVSNDTFKRLVDSIDNRTIVIPLSGGYDSRYIATMLKKMNYTNVVCFTYGKEDSYEVKISKNIANRFGFKWYFIEYSDDIVKETICSEEFKECNYYCANLSSVPHFQDYIAVKYLYDNKLISKNSVFVPGHSGDLLGGSHLRSMYMDYSLNNFSDISNLKETMYEYWYKYNNFNNEKHINKKIYKSHINNFFKEFTISMVNYLPYVTDSWNIANRQGKFIVNSCRVYKYFGYEVRLPLFDRKFVEYWLSLPLEYKIDTNLYNEFLLFDLFKDYDVAFTKKSTYSKVKKTISKYLGKTLYRVLKQNLKTKKSDINNFNVFIYYLLKDINRNFKLEQFHIDHVSAVWYLELIKDRIKK